MKYAAIFILLINITLGCAPRDKYLINMAKEGKVNAEAPLQKSVSIEINAPITTIWKIIINVDNWMTWNKSIRAVRSNGPTFLGDNFAWHVEKKTHTMVTVFEPPVKLVWFSRASSFRSIMKWELEKLSENRSRVTLTESRDGFFMNFKSNQELEDDLHIWLNNLKFESEVSGL